MQFYFLFGLASYGQPPAASSGSVHDVREQGQKV